MSKAAAVKLSPALKSLVNLPSARGTSLPPPPAGVVRDLFSRISSAGEKNGVGRETWLTLGTAAVITVNSPPVLTQLYDFAAEKSRSDVRDKAQIAAIMREAGLKCISLDGIPRVINGLGAIRNHLPDEVYGLLSKEPTRKLDSSNIDAAQARGAATWQAIYQPHAEKLYNKLGSYHPDLSVYILGSHYSALLSDPFSTSPPGGYKIGRVLTSVVAMACLRTQQGVGPQLMSHVLGLIKANVEGGGAEDEQKLDGQDWLCSEDGAAWVLESADAISEAIAGDVPSFGGPVARQVKS